MRVTAEQFERRQENRITGVYEVKPPNTERRGRKKVAPCCENCGLETEYLFSGFIYPLKKVGNDEYTGMTPLEFMKSEIECEPVPGEVCLRCRPLSNLELEEAQV